jgi:L-ascorbate metabolism protein UlaG (beta-lactamase superfamily)
LIDPRDQPGPGFLRWRLGMGAETLTWLGYSSFRVDAANGTRVYIDPWRTNPNCPQFERDPERIDVLALTYAHDDPPRGRHPRSVPPAPAGDRRDQRAQLVARRALGPDHDFQRMNRGGIHTVRGVRIAMTHARHSSSVWPDDSQSGLYVGEPVGFILHLERARRSTSPEIPTCSATWRSFAACTTPT